MPWVLCIGGFVELGELGKHFRRTPPWIIVILLTHLVPKGSIYTNVTHIAVAFSFVRAAWSLSTHCYDSSWTYLCYSALVSIDVA